MHDDFIDSSGVYAIVKCTSFHLFCPRSSIKAKGGVGPIFVEVLNRRQSYAGCKWLLFRLNLGYDNDGMDGQLVVMGFIRLNYRGEIDTGMNLKGGL